MSVCKNCGYKTAAFTKFCPECGSATGVSKESSDEVSVGGLQTLAVPQNATDTRRNTKDVSVGDAVTRVSVAGGAGPEASVHGTPLAGRYELMVEIGRGGFARVWKARDKKLGRIVAIKRLLPDSQAGGGNEQALVRFRREAQAIAQLNHRNIVAVFDHDQDEEGDYIVMEFVDGGTLRDYLKAKGGALTVPDAVEIARGVVQGLDHAHRKNLIHRDIKPANILLQEAPEEVKGLGLEWIPKIVDFGLARAGAETGVSLSGYGMGTPAYMPPEQRRDAKNINHTADFYAVGKTLYEMVSGMPPDDVDPEKIPAVSGLSDVIFKCIKSNADERFFSADELLAALSKVRGQRTAARTAVTAAVSNACPACGAVNPDGVKFCEGCGSGLTRTCPECGRENSVHKQFCGGCGTDVAGFLVAQDALVRIKKYAEERRWSRVQKESKSLNPDVRLNGAKGSELLRTLASLADEGARMLRDRDRLEVAIGKAAEQDGKAEEALRLIAQYQGIDPHKDWAEEVRKLEKRACEYGLAEAHSAAERSAENKKFGNAVNILKAYLAKYPSSSNREQVVATIARFEKAERREADDRAFETAKKLFENCLKTGEFRAAEKACETYIGNFECHVKEAEALKKQAFDLDESKRQQQQVRLERKLKRLKLSVAFGVAAVLALLAVRSGVALWRIYVFESTVGKKDLQACQQSAKGLIWFYTPEKVQAKVDAVGSFLQKRSVFLSLLGDKAQLLKAHGGPEWSAVQKLVAEAENPGDPAAGSKAYDQGTGRLKRVLEQVQAYQDARDSFAKTVADREQELSRYGGAQWASIKQQTGQADVQNDPTAGAATFADCTKQAKGIIERIQVFTDARRSYRMQVGANEKALAQYGGAAWAAVEKVVAAAENELDPSRGAVLYTRASELSRPVIADCERAIAARSQWETLRRSFNAEAFAKYAPKLFRHQEDLQKSAEAETDAVKAVPLYEELITGLEKAKAEMRNREEAEMAMLSARDACHRSAAAVDETLAKKHVPEEWRLAQELVAKADQDSGDAAKFEDCQASYESASKAISALCVRLDAMSVAKRQFEKKQALFEEEFKDLERAAPAEWSVFQKARAQALSAQVPEECIRLFREMGLLLEKTVKAYDQMTKPSDKVAL